MRTVSISACLNGWVCQVGCQTVVFTSRSELLSWLDRYMQNPTATEAAFVQGAANQHLFKVAPLPDPNQRPFVEGGLMTEMDLLRIRRQQERQQRMAMAAREDPSHSIGAERSNPVGYESVQGDATGNPVGYESVQGDATGVR